MYKQAACQRVYENTVFYDPEVELEGRLIVESPSVKLLGINISNDMSWHDHVVSIGKTASQKLGGLFRRRKLYTPCSSELSQIITPKAGRKKNTREALHAHAYQVEAAIPRTSLLQHSFFWKISTLWNELSRNLFPDGYN
nr:unnamed protein product [Callosobruchus analis]